MSKFTNTRVDQVLDTFKAELHRAVEVFPEWPSDPLHADAVLSEEKGEMTQAALQVIYGPKKSNPTDVREECVQLGAMCVRFLLSMDEYRWTQSRQHEAGIEK